MVVVYCGFVLAQGRKKREKEKVGGLREIGGDGWGKRASLG
jgi:hypothetical protein